MVRVREEAASSTSQQCYCAPELARIFCSLDNKHLNHGVALAADATGPDARAKVAGRLSKGLLSWVQRRLLLGVAASKILEEHNTYL